MSVQRKVRFIKGPYFRDLLEQPRVLQQAVEGLPSPAPIIKLARGLHRGRYRRVLCTGMGTSLHALYPLHFELSRHDVPSCWMETAELLLGFNALRTSDTLLIVLSQSGESAEVVQLLRKTSRFGHVIGITNDSSSTLARHAHTVLPLNAGIEHTVSCKSYLASLAVLHWLGAILSREDPAIAIRDLRKAQDGACQYLVHWQQHMRSWLATITNVESLFIIGRGPSLATAGTGGLILKESTLHPAEGMSTAAFRHGPLEMAGPNTLVIACAGDPEFRHLNRRLYLDIIRGGGRAVWMTTRSRMHSAFHLPPVIPALLPLVEILPIQMLSLALAARDGREAGSFIRASKITVTP